MQTLDSINAMFATMGERPVTSLNAPHRFMNAARKTLEAKQRMLLAAGWWFNSETNVLAPNGEGNIVLGGDVLNAKPTACKAHFTKRGNRLYDSKLGTYQITESLTCEVVRLLDFEDIPESVAQYISAEAVLQFQSDYDGDSDKRRRLVDDRNAAKILAVADQTRNVQGNMITGNVRLARLKGRIGRPVR